MSLEGEDYPATHYAGGSDKLYTNICASGFANAPMRGGGRRLKYPDPIKRRAPKKLWEIIDDYAESENPDIGGYMTEEMMDKALVKYLLTYRKRNGRI